ncbi:MAG: Rrf2 family transcriptional regulator [Eubacteriales bacterium]|nr:Rrf2 family transcriptional regulator [Eubacteriales bacterium]MDD4323638.1 Rrf2 family transcriptional regulator [Eubacteriales bacterium]MDD4540837.1 Rrf2 family transcriptional regulator [Eubacteriales bacterium]
MQLNITTDYAIRAVLHLAKSDQVQSTTKIAEEMKIPGNYLPSIIQKLREAGIVSVKRGAKGGSCLAKPANEISLYEVINAMETTTLISKCLEPDGYCNRDATADCKVNQAYYKLQTLFDDCMQEVHFDDLI